VDLRAVFDGAARTAVAGLARGVLKVAHADHELARRRIAREAEALGSIGGPTVPTLIDHGVHDGRAWIAMERVDGAPLSDVLAAALPGPDEAIALTMQLLDALARIHAAGWLHRDLKPDNIVRRPTGQLVVLDLGLARRIPRDDDDPTRANVQVGSLEYMAPEQAAASPDVDARTDLYGLGCVVYEVCTGRPPFVGDAAALQRAHAALRPPPASSLAAHVPPALEALCADCLAKDPARRPASAAAARARLVTAIDTGTSRSRHQSTMARGREPVVLVWLELPKVDRALVGQLQARRATVLSQRGRRVLAALLGADHGDPAGAAIELARELAAAGARVAVHLDALVVAADGAVIGDSAERPDGWIPQGTWTGVALTRAMAAAVRAPTRPAPDLGAGVAMLAVAGDEPPLIGRDALLADLAADAAAVLAVVPGLPSPGPGLSLVVGDAGVGKTALLGELARRLGELGARVHVGAVPPQGSGKSATSALADLLPADGPRDGATVRVVGDALRAAARTQPLAVLLDDIHHADHDLLDALEYATLGGEPMPLWVLCTAPPRFDTKRPGFGRRAERPRRDDLPPLDDDAAVALGAALLAPAEYPPLRALRRLASFAHGNPLHLAMLTRDLRERGAIKTRPNGEAFLETTALDAIAPVALGPWLATRAIAGLGDETVALARIASVLGDDVSRDELVAVIAAVERAGGATTDIDVDVGLRELADAGVVVPSPRGWRFPQALVSEGLYATTDADHRRGVHAAALDYDWARGLATDDADALTRIARHAEAVDDHARAAQAFATLGERAQRAHRTFDADRGWEGALRNLGSRDATLARAYLGRARTRYRLQRVHDALSDLEAALVLAGELADPALEAELAIEQGIVLDWAADFAGSAAAVARARARVADVPPSEHRRHLELAIELGEARAALRGHIDDALPPLLETLIARADAVGDYETTTIARIMLAPILAQLARVADAERVFDELIARCRAAHDTFYLAVALSNRTVMWSVAGDVARAGDDLATVIQLAREDGQPTIERAASYNLAQDRLWAGSFADALALAQRCLSLQRGHGEGSTTLDQLLIARIHAARQDDVHLREILTTLPADRLDDTERAVAAMLGCYVDRRPVESWTEAFHALIAAPQCEAEYRFEFAVLARRCGALDDAARAEVRALATTHPVWSRRIDEL
jgi:tRNA A-37 threonylcarbamoyl transferase component Bud32/tetratricopeptide (TPR) repeat protein